MDTHKIGYTYVALSFAFIQIAWSLECASNQHDVSGLRCCTKCEPGFGVKIPCYQENDTICEPCRHGETFSAHSSHEKRCKPCQICPQYSYVKHQCNETHDTVCECDRNYYWNDETGSCRQCEQCPMGYGAKRRCELHRNTVCARCPKGTYSDDISANSCRPCSSCRANQLLVRVCDAMQDSLCVDIKPEDIPTRPTYTVIASTTQNVVPPPEDKKTDSKNILIPLCIGALGLVVIILIIYVVVKQVNNHRNGPNNQGNKKNISYSAVNDPVPTTLAHAGVTAQQGSDSGVSGVDQDPKSTTRVSDLPQVKLQAISTALHKCQGSWTNFARELGYNSAAVASFETRATQEGRQPAELVLVGWSNNESATVEALTQVLRNIGRDDIIHLIYSDSRSLAQYSVQNMSNLSGGALSNSSAPQNMSHHNMSVMGRQQNYYAPSTACAQPNMVPPQNVIPAHQIITDPRTAAPPAVYLQHGGACSNSSGECGVVYNPNQVQTYQQMHTQPTQGQMV